MFYGYDKAKQVSKNDKRRVSLEEINMNSKKYLKREVSKKEILMVVQAIATGRIHSPMNYVPFKKMVKQYPNQKALLQKHTNELFDQMISYTFKVSRTLYTNAYLSKKSMPYYDQFMKYLHLHHVSFDIKEISNKLDPMKEDQNIWKALEVKYQEIINNYSMKDQEVTKHHIAFAKTYEMFYQNAFSPHHQLLDGFEQFLQDKDIEKVHVCSNEIYNMMVSYFRYFEDQLVQHEMIPREMLSKMENLYKQMKSLFGEAEFVTKYYQLLQKIKDYNVVFMIETYDVNKESFFDFCSRNNLSHQSILTRLERRGENELLLKIKRWLESSMQERQEEEQKMLDHFVSVLTRVVEKPDALTSFTLAHYYALTSYSLDHMVRYLEHQGYRDLHQFLFRFYCKHVNDEKSYRKIDIALDEKVISLVKTQITQQHFPKKIGLFYQAYDMFEQHALTYFTKEYFREDLKNWLEEKEDKVKQKVQN